MSTELQESINRLAHPALVQARVIELMACGQSPRLTAHMYTQIADWLTVRVSEPIQKEGKTLFEAGDLTIARKFSRYDDMLDADNRSRWLAYSARAERAVIVEGKQVGSYG